MPWPMVPAPSTVTVLTSTEVRFPFFEIRLQAFLRIFALKQALLKLAFERQALVEAGFEAGLHGALDVADGFGSLVGRSELLRVVLHGIGKRPAVQIGVTPDVIDDAEVLGVFEREERPCSHHLDRPGLADEAREALRTACAGQHA